MLPEDAKATGRSPQPRIDAPAPARDRIESVGQWQVARDTLLELEHGWTDEFMATGSGLHGSGALAPKGVQLSIAFDASFTHM
jgi:hypothetical protein